MKNIIITLIFFVIVSCSQSENSSINNMPGVLAIAEEKASRACIPLEYVLRGISKNSPKPLNSAISGINLSTSFLLRPLVIFDRIIFSYHVASNSKPKPISRIQLNSPLELTFPEVGE